MSEVRIIHSKNPARPEAPDGIITVEVNGNPIRMPHKGHDKVIKVTNIEFQIHDEISKELQDI